MHEHETPDDAVPSPDVRRFVAALDQAGMWSIVETMDHTGGTYDTAWYGATLLAAEAAAIRVERWAALFQVPTLAAYDAERQRRARDASLQYGGHRDE